MSLKAFIFSQLKEILTLYHGSDTRKEIKNIRFSGTRNNCDFGRSFYTTDNIEVVEEWVVRTTNPIINIYSLVIDKRKSCILQILIG